MRNLLTTWRHGPGPRFPSPQVRTDKRRPLAGSGIMLALAIALAGSPAAGLSPVAAQEAAGAAAAPLRQEKLEALVAPIALYPDQLLSQTLMAATYPLDVVEAARFVKANPGLKGEALDKAVAGKKWDPSVQSLTAFPQVLDMMDKRLDWTQELGNAFLSDEARVLKTVQGLRQRAESAGTLKSGEQLKVVKEQDVIVIQPAQPQVVYVPTYDPAVAYGTWPAPAYPPYYYQPPPAYTGGAVLAAGLIGFGLGVAASDNHWGWSDTNWHGGSVNVNVNRNNAFVRNNPQYKAAASGGKWQFNSAQRRGVAYGDAATRARYQNVNPNDVAARRGARGYAPGTASAAQLASAQRPGGAAGAEGGGRRGAGTTAGAERQAGTRAQGAQTGAGRDQGQAGARGGREGAERAGREGADRAGGRTQGADLGGGRSQGADFGGGRSQAGGSRAGAQGAGGGLSRSSGGRAGFDPGQSRQQAQSFSSRGASSRASMGGGGMGGGGGRRGR